MCEQRVRLQHTFGDSGNRVLDGQTVVVPDPHEDAGYADLDRRRTLWRSPVVQPEASAYQGLTNRVGELGSTEVGGASEADDVCRRWHGRLIRVGVDEHGRSEPVRVVVHVVPGPQDATEPSVEISFGAAQRFVGEAPHHQGVLGFLQTRVRDRERHLAAIFAGPRSLPRDPLRITETGAGPRDAFPDGCALQHKGDRVRVVEVARVCDGLGWAERPPMRGRHERAIARAEDRCR